MNSADLGQQYEVNPDTDSCILLTMVLPECPGPPGVGRCRRGLQQSALGRLRATCAVVNSGNYQDKIRFSILANRDRISGSAQTLRGLRATPLLFAAT